MKSNIFISNNNPSQSHINIQVNDENTLKIFSSDYEELEYVNNYFKSKDKEGQEKSSYLKDNKNQLNVQDSQINPINSKYKPITITKQERLALVQAILYNDNLIMPFVATPSVMESLRKKGFIEKKDSDAKLYSVKQNVNLLFDIEGYKAFDEIVEKSGERI